MGQAAEIQTAEQLDERLRTVLANERNLPQAGGAWPAQFSIKPVMGGNLTLTITQEDGKPQNYSLWLQKGASGEYDSFVLLNRKQVQDIFTKEAIEGVLTPITRGINPINKDFKSGPTGENAWFQNGQKVDLGFKVEQVWVDPRNKQIIEDPGAIKHAPARWWVKSDANLKPGDVVADTARFDPTKGGYSYDPVSIDVSEDPAVKELSARTAEFSKAAGTSYRAAPAATVPREVVEASAIARFMPVAQKPVVAPQVTPEPVAAAPVLGPADPSEDNPPQPLPVTKGEEFLPGVPYPEPLLDRFSNGQGPRFSQEITDMHNARREAMRQEMGDIQELKARADQSESGAKLPLEGPVAQDAVTRAGQGKNYVTVDMGGDKGIGVLWQDGKGGFNVLTMDQVYDRINNATNAGAPDKTLPGVQAWTQHLIKLATPLDEIAKITDGRQQKADFDFSKIKPEDMAAEAQKLGERIMKETQAEPAKPGAAIPALSSDFKPV